MSYHHKDSLRKNVSFIESRYREGKQDRLLGFAAENTGQAANNVPSAKGCIFQDESCQAVKKIIH